MMSRRSSFIERVRAIRQSCGDEKDVFLFSADFADFKLINHIYGFAQGDELLRDTIEFLNTIPECSMCERTGADRFVFVIASGSNLTDEGIIRRYEEFSTEFIKSHQYKYPDCELKFWCGIYQIEDDDILTALDNADMARTQAKENGYTTANLVKNSMIDELASLRHHESEIMSAIKEERFLFFLQPQVDLKTGKIVGAEALARGIDKDGNVTFPDAFVSVLERNHHIVDLDCLILEKVCRYIRERLDRNEPVVRTSVNLSRQHLWDMNSADRLNEIVNRYKIPHELIIFEITENILITDFTGAVELNKRLRNWGYGTSIDDFGSGYAGIDIWHRVSFDELKLDRIFLDDAPEMKSKNEVIIRGLVWIAHNLGTYVICEGVERADQCRGLLEKDCRFAQGYYFSKPIPPDEFYDTYKKLNGHYPVDYLDAF